MANFVSPGVYVVEKDISDYTPAVNPTVVGIVGFATRGPVNVPTLITSQESLVRTFGRPSDALPGQGIEGGLEILETANQNYYIRAVDETTAAQAVARLNLGSCPAFEIQGDWGTGTAADDLTMEIQVTDSNGVDQYAIPRQVIIPQNYGATTAGEAFMNIIGGQLDADKIGVFKETVDTTTTYYLVGYAAGSAAKLTVTANGVCVSELDADGTAGTANTPDVALIAEGLTFEEGSQAAGLGYKVESLYPGTGYNTETLPDGTILGNSIAVQSLGSRNVTINVNDGGVAEEAFKVSLTNFGNFVELEINTGLDNLKSEFIMGSLENNGGTVGWTPSPFTSNLAAYTTLPVDDSDGNTVDPKFVKIVGSHKDLTGGEDGVPSSPAGEAATLIGSVGGESGRTGMQALINETAPITIAIVPGISDQNVQSNLITLAENSGDFLAVVGTPNGYTLQSAIAFTNGQDIARTAALNSSYAAVYYPHVKVFQPYLAKDIWMDPAIFGVRQMGYTDTVSDLWFAPAGFVRGRLTKPVDTEVDLNQGDRDSMYSGGNVLNPIVNFPQQGITIFGQRTTQRAPTALDRINVRRLMIYIKRVITQSTTRFIFEPNDKITQERIQQLLIPLFEDIKRRRGITEFKVVCDETVNTPVRVDRNELWCKVLIKPTKTAEVLIFELNITNQSANLG